ncbi:MAG: amidase [Candidatus Bipolaricaulia bacterium]
MTIAEAAQQIREGSLSPVALTQATLDRIEQLNPRLNAFLAVTADEALHTAQQLEQDALDERLLNGIPVALKDLFDVQGVPTTAGTKILSDNVPSEDAAVTERLRRAGAVLVGKLAMHEWALGVTNENPHFGPTHNPWNTDHIPGGSSGGSGTAVAAGLCLGALGSDTGGSIRIPAALCGIVGLKPTYGRISIRGVVPLSWSLDHVGPMTKTVEDAALMLQVLAGFDPIDPTSPNVPVDDYRAGLETGVEVEGLGILVPTHHFFDDLNPEVDELVRTAIITLSKLGATVQEVVVEAIDVALIAGGMILLADAAAYHEDDLKRRADEFGSDLLTRLRRGRETEGIAYARARRAQMLWRRSLEGLLSGGAVLATPTTPIPAPRIGELDPVDAARTLTRFTLPFNLAGLPAISVPCGFTQAGLPIGLQLVGRPWDEAILLRVAHAYQQVTDWHRHHPSL